MKKFIEPLSSSEHWARIGGTMDPRLISLPRLKIARTIIVLRTIEWSQHYKPQSPAHTPRAIDTKQTVMRSFTRHSPKTSVSAINGQSRRKKASRIGSLRRRIPVDRLPFVEIVHGRRQQNSKGTRSRLRDKSPVGCLPFQLSFSHRFCPRVRACTRVQRESDRPANSLAYTCWFIDCYTRDSRLTPPRGNNGTTRCVCLVQFRILLADFTRKKTHAEWEQVLYDHHALARTVLFDWYTSHSEATLIKIIQWESGESDVVAKTIC